MKLKHLLCSLLLLLSAGTAWADVRINTVNFPDANFRNYLLSQSYGSDGLLTDAEIAQIKSLMLSSKSIQNLNGIKNFTALQYLTCNGNQLTSLDVSGCESLIELDCSNNKLTSLDVSGCESLIELDCSNNKLTSLDVSGCSALTSIICAQNQLKGDAMDDLIAGLPTTQDCGLYVINVKSDGNAMTIDQVQSAKAKGWTAYALYGSWSEYAGSVLINETNFPDAQFRNFLLGRSYGSDGLLSDAEIAEIKSLMLSSKSIQNLNGIKNFTALQYLTCDGNQLTTLDVSGCESLIELDCSNNKLTSLNVSGCSALTSIICPQNQLKGDAMNDLIESLPTTQDGGLYVINVKSDGNTMTIDQVQSAKAKGWTSYVLDGSWSEYAGFVLINATNFPDAQFRNFLLGQSYGSDGKLSDAEIASIRSLILSSKSIQNLNGIKNFTALQYLTCNGNQLTSLDVSGCESLIELNCSNNKLTSLNVSGCSALTSIICAQNRLKGDAMDDLIAGLPATQDGGLYVINVKSDGNAMTIDQVQSAKAKGWTSYALDGSWSEYAGVGININAVRFPDEQFRSWLLNQSYGSDGVLTDAEIAGVTGINVSGTSSSPGTISSLKGIEYFTALTSLTCNYNQLTSLDLTKNTKLTELSCGANQLTSLDVSKNTKLTELSCGANKLTSLDVSKNIALTKLYCSKNQLTSLDVSKNTELKELSCSYNQFTSLDVSGCTALTDLSCSYNHQLTSLDVSGCAALTSLDCYYNQLTSLDVSKNTRLSWLECYGNQLTSLDVTGCTMLDWLYCYSNQLTSLDVSKNTELSRLLCDSNKFTSLDVSKNRRLSWLDCYNNQLTSLDLSRNTKLYRLSCYQNQIKGEGMDALVASLPTVIDRSMRVVYYENEQNVMTTTQVDAAKAKGWIPRYTDGSSDIYGVQNWYEYAGVDPSTGVNNVEASETDDSAPWYTINGTLLSEKPTAAGIYIHNGKKVLVK